MTDMFGTPISTQPASVRVNRVPDYANAYRFWVVRLNSAELWFYGAWNDRADANRVAREENGFVVENGEVA